MSVFIARPKDVSKTPFDDLPDELSERSSHASHAKFLVGWREWLALPDLGIPGIKAKVDTGARTSALHTHDYTIFDGDRGECVRFHIHPLVRRPEIEITCEAPLLDRRQVKDSGGHPEDRPFIETTARIGRFEWKIQMSLTSREGMKFRMLLGRTALAGLFLVDSRSSFLMGSSLFKSYPRR
ncbi:ATP-dependent zinc protease [soil metagenome]